ncbi:putative signal peptide protein [Puccinia sorghi]|uniref:Putative signal peptide protein n=1 Tax=Puccinia sorghi TaxID=27349 RepID=A0A0L6UWV2_9BASI|nr:putative signal peptide protein [Puccinia sorghi]KNZ53031.1 putative signal peptide protein [Puccinia sorghi]
MFLFALLSLLVGCFCEILSQLWLLNYIASNNAIPYFMSTQMNEVIGYENFTMTMLKILLRKTSIIISLFDNCPWILGKLPVGWLIPWNYVVQQGSLFICFDHQLYLGMLFMRQKLKDMFQHCFQYVASGLYLYYMSLTQLHPAGSLSQRGLRGKGSIWPEHLRKIELSYGQQLPGLSSFSDPILASIQRIWKNVRKKCQCICDKCMCLAPPLASKDDTVEECPMSWSKMRISLFHWPGVKGGGVGILMFFCSSFLSLSLPSSMSLIHSQTSFMLNLPDYPSHHHNLVLCIKTIYAMKKLNFSPSTENLLLKFFCDISLLFLLKPFPNSFLGIKLLGENLHSHTSSLHVSLCNFSFNHQGTIFDTCLESAISEGLVPLGFVGCVLNVGCIKPIFVKLMLNSRSFDSTND